METLTVNAELEKLNEVLGFVDASLEAHDCPMKAVLTIDVAIEELFVNIAHYAYPETRGDATIEIEYEEDPRRVIIRLSDAGTPYNPLARKDPDITLSAQEREIGGLGVYMVKKTMNDVFYEYADGRNALTIVKHF